MQNQAIIHAQILTDSQKRADFMLDLLHKMLLDKSVDLNNLDTVNQGIHRASHFFKQAFYTTGFWSDFNTVMGGGRDWISGYVGYALACSQTIDAEDLNQISCFLLSDRCPSGAWGYHPGLQIDADSTSWATLFLQKSQTVWNNQPTIDVLLGHQDKLAGGIPTYFGPQFGIAEYMEQSPQADFSGWCSAHVCVSAAVAQALIACGVDTQHNAIEHLKQFIYNTQHADGYWNSYWFHSKTYATAQCIRALIQMGESTESPILQRAVRWIETTQLLDGSWNSGMDDDTAGRVFDTALAVWASVNFSPEHQYRCEKAVMWLLEKQRPDGSWDSLPILHLPLPTEHTPWNIKNWPEMSTDPTQGICVSDHNRYFTTASALQALSAWNQRKIFEK